MVIIYICVIKQALALTALLVALLVVLLNALSNALLVALPLVLIMPSNCIICNTKSKLLKKTNNVIIYDFLAL